MGYTINKNKICSDNAECLYLDVLEAIIKKLRANERKRDNCWNTEGVVDVAITLINLDMINHFEIQEYAGEFIPKFEIWIEKQAKLEEEVWDTLANRNKHIKAYRKLLADLKKKYNYKG